MAGVFLREYLPVFRSSQGVALFWMLAASFTALGVLCALRSRAARVLFMVFTLLAGAYHHSTAISVMDTEEHFFKSLPPEGKSVSVLGRVSGLPETAPLFRGGRRNSFYLDLRRVAAGERDALFKARLLVYSYDEQKEFSPGDHVFLTGTLRPPRPQGAPGGFDQRSWLRRKGASGILVNGQNDLYFKVGEDRTVITIFTKAVYRMRKYAEKLLERYVDGEALGFMKAVLIGKRSFLTDRSKEVFSRTGTAHVLAVSGLHVGMIGAAAVFLLGAFKAPKPVRHWGGVLSVLLFCAFSGGRISSIRAALMFSFMALGLVKRGRGALVNSLAGAALAAVFISPLSLLTGAFALSFLAVLSIIILLPVFERVFPFRFSGPKTFFCRMKLYITTSVSVSSAVWIGLLPVLGAIFGLMTPVSVAANLVAIPALFVMLSSGMIGLIASAAGFPHAVPEFIFSFTSMLYGALTALLEAASALPFAWGHLPVAGKHVIASYYALLALFCVLIMRSRRPRRIALIFLIAAANLMVWTVFTRRTPRAARVTFFDAGAADAAVVELPSGEVFLFDGGSAIRGHGRMLLGPYLRAAGISSIDAVFLSHAHEDHIGGLFYVLENFRVGRVFSSGVKPQRSSERRLYDRFRALLEDENVPYERVLAGDVINYPGEVLFFVLNPSGEERYENLNDASVVVAMELAGSKRVLFTGDAEEKAIRSIMRFPSFIESDILKAPHHGQRTGCPHVFELFADAASAETTVVTNSSRGALDKSSIRSLQKAGSRVHLTGEEGYARF